MNFQSICTSWDLHKVLEPLHVVWLEAPMSQIHGSRMAIIRVQETLVHPAAEVERKRSDEMVN